MFSIWPFRPRPSRLQQVKNTLGDVVEGAEHAIHEVSESASDLLHSATQTMTSNVVPAVTSSFANVVEATSGAAHQVSQKAGDVSGAFAKNAANTLKHLKSRGEDVGDSAQKAASKSARTIAKTAAAQTARAQSSWNAARDASSTRLHDLAHNAAETSGELGSGIAQKAAHAAHATAKSAQQTRENIGERAHDAQQNLVQSVGALVAGVLAARENLGEHWADRKDETSADAKRFPLQNLPKVELSTLSQATSQFGSKLQNTKHNAARRARDAASRFSDEPTYDELRLRLEKISNEKNGDSRFLWLAFGIISGVILALLLAPNSGRRSRAALRDQIGKAGRSAKNLGQSALSKKTDLSNRIEGKLRERAAQKTEDDADDITIANRVRTALGESEVARTLERINVDCIDGMVTLRGPIVEGELQTQIETLVRGIKGVRDVRSDLLISDAPEDEQTFVG